MIRFLLVGLALSNFAVPASAQPKPDENAPKVDEAIKQGLEYLKSKQNQDGSWSGGAGRQPAITGLAVMAFLSAGHVPGEGKYGKVVENGVRAMIKMQNANGLIASDHGHQMYHHGICTLMLAEAAGMTQGPLAADVKKALEKAVVIVLQAQRKGGDRNKGGWRYQVAGADADMSVTGWQLLALRAAKNVGCDVPPDAIASAVDYIKRSQDPYTGAFTYTPGGGSTIPCTGTGILGLCVCSKEGVKSAEALKAGAAMLRSLREPGYVAYPLQYNGAHFFYSVYYASQATFQLGGNYWETYRPHIHKMLISNRNKQDGSWVGSDGHGPIYSSSMAILALTVEYRFLPIYQRGEEPTDKK